MTTYTVKVASPDIVGRRMDDFHRLFIANRDDVLRGAIVNSGLYGEIWKRTPKADRQRYGKSAGRMQLARSIMPAGAVDPQLKRLPKVYTAHTLSYVFGSDKSYAPFVHNTQKPAEGHYWDRHSTQSSGYASGWSTPRTGNKFLEKPIMESQDKVLRALDRNIQAVMKKGGVF